MPNNKEQKPSGAPDLPKGSKEALSSSEESESPKPSEAAKAKTESLKDNLDDKTTDAAVEDIIKSDSDELLEAEDKDLQLKPPVKVKKRWYKKAKFWWVVVFVLLVGMAIAAGIPQSRYFALNKAGVRVQSSVEVLDATSGQPLKNVTVSFNSQSALTDSSGLATVGDLKLGPQTLVIERVGFASINRQVILGWGSNPLGSFKLTATGIQVSLNVSDYLSGQAIAGAEATSGQAVARSDESGKITLTLPGNTQAEADVVLAASGYRSESLKIPANQDAPTAVSLVPAAKTIFVSNDSGRYDLFSMDIDGQNKQLLLEATGRENGNITVLVNPAGSHAAMVSTRDDARNGDGSLQDTIVVVTLADGTITTPDRAAHIQIMDWVGNRIIYQTIDDVAPTDPKRQQIISFDVQNNSRALLASDSKIDTAAVALGSLYFAGPEGLVRASADGTTMQPVAQGQISSILRSNYAELSFLAGDSWQKLDLRTSQVSAQAEPSSLASRAYVISESGRAQARASRATLYLEQSGQDERELVTTSGLTYPLRWLNEDVIVFRVATNQEVADYAVSISGGEPKKVADVVATLAPNQSF